jgi:DNA-binding MurR/RpiR family transcriptional regulator
VLGIAIWRYVRDSVRMFEEACRLVARGIALTDSLVSPLTPQADIVLLAADSAPRLSHSLTGMLSLVNVIADGVSTASPPDAVETLRKLDSMFDDFDAIFG